jgi:hypothetical protein
MIDLRKVFYNAVNVNNRLSNKIGVHASKAYVPLCIILSIFVVTSLVSYEEAHAETVTWDGGGNGQDWFDFENWNPDGFPEAADDITIPSGVTVHLDDDYALTGSLSVESGGALIIDTTDELFGNELSNAGTINNDGNIDIMALGILDNNPSGIINNTGTIYIAGGGTLENSDYATINNDGTVENAEDGAIDNYAYGVLINAGTLTNYGTYNIGVNLSNGETALINKGTLDNYGVVDNIQSIANSGTINNAGSFDNGGPIRSFGTNHIINNNGGTFIFCCAGGLTLGSSGIFNNNAGTVKVDGGGSIIDRGSIINAGTFDVEDFGSVTIQHGTFDSTGGAVLTIFGRVNVESGGHLTVGGGGVFYIDSETGRVFVWCTGTFTDLGGGFFDGTVEYETPCDTSAPEITILGSNPAMILLGSTYADAGVTVTDDFDSSPTLTTESTVNTAIAGTYIVTYTAEDDAGNTGTATRTVKVITPSAATQSLIDMVNSQVTDKNTKSALLSTLKEIQKILNDGNSGNDQSACSKLTSFIVTVDSKEASGKLSSTLAQQYRDLTKEIMNSLGC